MQNRLRLKKMGNKAGFTIIELLIAMAGFSFVLLLVTVVMINIGSLYSKGINQTRIDDAARSMVDDVSARLKYNKASTFYTSTGTIGSTSYTNYCINKAKFSFSSSLTGANFLRRGVFSSSCPIPVLDDSNTGTNLLPQNSKLAYFNIVNNGSNFTINISIVYGSFDNTNVNSLVPLNDTKYRNIKCNTGTSYQYCAVTNLSTVVSSRLN